MLKIIEMQRKKTGMLFEFCCIAPIIIKKDKKNFNKFSSIGSDIGLLFQIADDLIDQSGNSKKVGKKTKKDQKKGKATLISLLGYKNAINNIAAKIYTYTSIPNLLQSSLQRRQSGSFFIFHI